MQLILLDLFNKFAIDGKIDFASFSKIFEFFAQINQAALTAAIVAMSESQKTKNENIIEHLKKNIAFK